MIRLRINMKKQDYLLRIGIEKIEISPTIENLRLLQRQHLLNIPFENLDIHWKRKIILDQKLFAAKIIDEGRGGFCYELNGLFFCLLEDLGFRSKKISARVNDGKDAFGEEYDHLAILTSISDDEFLVGVGFGDFAAEPLKFEIDIEQKDRNGIFLIRKHTDRYFEVVKKKDEAWTSQYIFKDIERDLSEFEGMCDFHQTSPESHFTRKKVCSLMTETGRKTLSDKKFIETVNNKRIETAINSEEEFENILKSEFWIKSQNRLP